MEITKNVVPLHSQSIREHSSVGLEHLPYKQRVRGSTPFAPTTKTTYRDVSRLFLCCFVWVFARSVGLAPRALAVAVCSDASIAQPSPSPAAFGCHSSPWQSHPLVFAKRCRTWIWGCGDRLILLLGLKPCAQRYPRQLRFDSLCSHHQDDLQQCESSFFLCSIARSVGLRPYALAVAVCSDASIGQPSPSPAAFGRHSSLWQSHPLVFAKRCRTWIWGCGDMLILLLGLKPCAQRYPRQLRFDSLFCKPTPR